MKNNKIYDCLIIGAGPVGLAMIRALQVRGLSACLAGQLPQESPNSPDLRTAALFDGSLRFLERLNVWSTLSPHASPISAIRIIDATGQLLRAPEQIFTAADLDAPQLGFNIPNPALVTALRHSLNPGISPSEPKADTHLNVKIEAITIAPDHVTATAHNGTILHGRIAIAADGRSSITRRAADITTKSWNHQQAAITAHIEHALPNEAISTEIHGKTGPCTVVPLGSHSSSLVWMHEPDAAAALAEKSDPDFIAALEQRLAGLLGPVRTVTPRRIFPLSSLIAERFAANRIALIGEAGHAFPPIGAQGLNLGLRDVAGLADTLATAKAAGHDIGADQVLDAYSEARRSDIMARTYGVDAFNQSLSGRAAGLVRGAVLHATKASPGIKRFLLERGLRPIGSWPTMMQ